VTVIGGAVLWAILSGKLRGAVAAAALSLAVVADLWSVDRLFFEYREPASVIFADDAITSRIRKETNPFRVLDVGVYQGSYLMAHRIMTMLGYHGFEIRYYDELLGGKNQWRNAGSPNLHDLLAVRYLLLPQEQDVPGFHRAVGPVTTTPGSVGVLLERDTVPPYVRVVPGAAKLPESQVVATIIDPRFPLNSVVVVSDTASLTPEPLRQGDSTGVRARLAAWTPGKMRVTLEGSDPRTTYLVIGENWYPDWHAQVDGKDVPVHRGDHTLLTVALPSGAREVSLTFASARFQLGRLVTLLAVLAVLGLAGWSVRRERSAAHG
jgi:hypothetical protein